MLADLVRCLVLLSLISTSGALLGCSPQPVPDSIYDCACSCTFCDGYDAGGACTTPHQVQFGATVCAHDGDANGALHACDGACNGVPSDLGCSVEVGPALRQAQACQAGAEPLVMGVQSPLARAAKVDPISTIEVTTDDGAAISSTVEGTLTIEGGSCSSAPCPLAITSLDLTLGPANGSFLAPSNVHALGVGRLVTSMDASGAFEFDPQALSLAGYGTFGGTFSSAQGQPLGLLRGFVDDASNQLSLKGKFHSQDGRVQAATLTLVVDITHDPPVAKASATTPAACGLPAHLDGSGSYARQGQLAAYAWYTGFGTPLQKRIASGPQADPVLPSGSSTVTLLVRDDQDALATTTVEVSVADVAELGITCPAQVDEECNALAPLSTYGAQATSGCGAALVQCTAPSPSGDARSVTCTATDAVGQSASCRFPVVVRDGLPPSVTLRKGPDGPGTLVWHADQKLRPFSLADCISSAVDRCDGPLALAKSARIVRITSDEPSPGPGGRPGACADPKPPWHGIGGTSDMVITGKTTAVLRAEREPRGNGRVYTVAFEVKDAHGNVAPGTCRVEVPTCPAHPAIGGRVASCIGTGCPPRKP
jgi:hypothetical protein